MSDPIADPGHGHSPAAWIAVTIMLIAVAIGTVAFVLDAPVIVWASAALLVVGLIVGWIARFLLPGKQNIGLIMTSLLGVAGSFAASYAGQFMGWYAPGAAAGRAPAPRRARTSPAWCQARR